MLKEDPDRVMLPLTTPTALQIKNTRVCRLKPVTIFQFRSTNRLQMSQHLPVTQRCPSMAQKTRRVKRLEKKASLSSFFPPTTFSAPKLEHVSRLYIKRCVSLQNIRASFDFWRQNNGRCQQPIQQKNNISPQCFAARRYKVKTMGLKIKRLCF